MPLLQSVRDLDKAFLKWWTCLKGKGKGKVRAPRFKKSSTRPSIRFTRNAFRVEGKTPELTRVGSIPVTWSRNLPSEPSSATVVKDCAGCYFASFVVEVERPEPEPSGKAVGIDLGLASLAVTSDGAKIVPAKFLRSACQGLRRLSGA